MPNARDIVTALEGAMDDNPGVGSVSVDGTTVTYQNPTEAIRLLEYWRNRLARSNGSKPLISGINMRGAF